MLVPQGLEESGASCVCTGRYDHLFEVPLFECVANHPDILGILNFRNKTMETPEIIYESVIPYCCTANLEALSLVNRSENPIDTQEQIDKFSVPF